MLPEKAQFLVRKGKYVTFKVNRVDIRKSEKVVMEMSTGFLRNISKGVGGADYRDLVIVSEFDPNLKRFISQIKGSESPLVCDHAELKLKTFPLKINEVYFFKQGVEMEAFKTNRLPTFHE